MEYPNEYTQIMQKMLADNAAAAETVVAGARAGQQAAAAELQAARNQLADNEQNAAQMLKEYTKQQRAQLEKHLHTEILEEMAGKLLKKGESVSTVTALLDMAERLVQRVFKRLGLRPVGSANAWLEYDEEGRSGYVILHHGKTVYRFSYEFGGGSTLAIIDIPAASHWEAYTGLPLADREAILEFIGLQVVADKAPGHRYRIDPDALVIY